MKRRSAGFPGLAGHYDAELVGLERLGFVEEVPAVDAAAEEMFCFLHCPVVRETAVSTKFSLVFDASAKGPNGVSLSDCLEVGPSLIPDLPLSCCGSDSGSFLSQGMCPRTFCRSVYIQMTVSPSFLWVKNGQPWTLQFRCVTFGVNCSTFPLNTTIKHHLRKYEKSHVVEELKTNLYVDDWLSGTDSETEVLAMNEEAIKIMADAGMLMPSGTLAV